MNPFTHARPVGSTRSARSASCSLKLRRRHAGTAMLETVLVLPLVFVILGLVFFFGSAFEREQQQRILARYDVARASNQATPLAPATAAGLNGQEAAMNELFFEGHADFVDIDWDSYLSPAGQELIGLAANRSVPTGDLAAGIVNGAQRGTKIKLSVDFARSNRIFEAVNGPIRRRSVHPGPSWAYADAMQQTDGVNLVTPPLTANWVYHRTHHQLRAAVRVRDVFYLDYDRQLDNFAEPATHMVSLIRGMLYARQPGYRGPTVIFNR